MVAHMLEPVLGANKMEVFIFLHILGVVLLLIID